MVQLTIPPEMAPNEAATPLEQSDEANVASETPKSTIAETIEVIEAFNIHSFDFKRDRTDGVVLSGS